jgi:tetratricopeptide (TPR) repeat protein
VREPSGESVVTKRVLRDFERVAAASGGSVLVADAWGALEPGALGVAARRGLAFGPGGSLEREVPASYDRAAAALAFALLLAELLAGASGWLGARARRRVALGAAAAALLGASAPDLETLEAQVRASPEDARTLVALGVARAETGVLPEAVHALTAAALRARAPEDVALASYDLGVALLALGDFAGARDAFLDAIAFDPADRQAKFNLEWALRALAQQEASEPPPPAAASEPSAATDDEAAEPEEEAREPEPSPERSDAAPAEPTAPRDSGGDTPNETPPLTPKEIARWLEALRDVPPPALRQAAEDAGARRSGPQW